MRTYSYSAFDGRNRIERNGLELDELRRHVGTLTACFYRVRVVDSRGVVVNERTLEEIS